MPGTDPLAPLIAATTSDALSAVINMIYNEWAQDEIDREGLLGYSPPPRWGQEEDDRTTWRDVEILGHEDYGDPNRQAHWLNRPDECNDWIALGTDELLPVQPLFGPPRTKRVWHGQLWLSWPEIDEEDTNERKQA